MVVLVALFGVFSSLIIHKRENLFC